MTSVILANSWHWFIFIFRSYYLHETIDTNEFNVYLFIINLSVGLVDCDYYEAYENNYTLFEPLTNLPNSQPDGYIARFPLYAIGARDAHIILTETNTPNWEKDWTYEICKNCEFLFRTF